MRGLEVPDSTQCTAWLGRASAPSGSTHSAVIAYRLSLPDWPRNLADVVDDDVSGCAFTCFPTSGPSRAFRPVRHGASRRPRDPQPQSQRGAAVPWRDITPARGRLAVLAAGSARGGRGSVEHGETEAAAVPGLRHRGTPARPPAGHPRLDRPRMA